MQLMSEGHTIQEAARRSGVSQHTLRFYERSGLLTPIARGKSGHRRYSEGDLGYLRFILYLRSTGMSMDDVRRYAALIGQGDATLEERRALLLQHRASVSAQLAKLQETLHVIDTKLEHYATLGSPGSRDLGCDPVLPERSPPRRNA